MKKGVTITIGCIVVLIAAYAAVSYVFSNKLLYPPLLSDEQIKAEYGPLTPGEAELTAEPVTFPSRDPNVTISGWWIENPGADRVFILVHGRNSNKKAMVDYATFFAKRGISTLLIDLRGHGESSPGYATFGDKERNDVLGALDFLAKRGFGPDKKIGCLGLSMGATAAYLAAMDADKMTLSTVDLIVFDSGIADVPSSIRSNAEKVVGGATPLLLPGAVLMAEMRSGANFKDASPIVHAADLSIPILFIMHTNDETVPFDDQMRLFQAYAGPKEDLVFEGLGHHRGFKEKRAEYEEKLSAFLKANNF